MTELLAKAFAKASELPEDEQEVIAALILKEIESERRWEQSLNDSQDALADLANEALAEHHAGKTKRLDPDDL